MLYLFMMKKNGVFGSWYVIVLVVLYKCCVQVQCHGELPNSNSNSSSNSNSNSNSRVWGIVMLRSILLGTTTGFGCALVCALFVRCIFTYIKKVPILKGPVVFSPEISPKSLQSALTNPDSTQTHHISGNYYKLTLLDNGVTVAVKKLQPFTFSSEENKNKKRRRIQRELEILGGLRHRHLMKLKAYVHDETNRFCLVYDYVPGGSLEDAMRTRSEQIGWDGRLRIAVGIIKGLDYLHLTAICHYNLKPSNVMLDADFEPTLADCGFPPTSNSHDGSGYYAPECYPDFSIYSSKSDIFSFGVILGILLTGRDPWDPLFGGDMGVWLRQVVESGDAREALDKSLLGEEMEEDEMLMAVRIAAVCLSHTPADRPSSHQLVPMLTQLNSF